MVVPLVPKPTLAVEDQVKVVPLTAPLKLMAAPDSPLQWVLFDMLLTVGVGLTVTSTVKEAPLHPPAVGVTVYRTTPAVVPVFVSVCWIEVPQPEVQSLKPAIVAPDCWAAVHVKVVPPTVEFSVTLVVAPLQMVAGEAEPTGVELTERLTVVLLEQAVVSLVTFAYTVAEPFTE